MLKRRFHLHTATVLALVPAICFFAAMKAARAQSSTAELGGQVTDQAGALVAGAKVGVRNVANGEMRQVQTDTSGDYLVTQLAPGAYELLVEGQGFRRFVQSGIDLQVGQRARIDARLTLGAVTESIEVTANATLLDTADAALGQAVENRKILDLPLNGRNIVGLAGLATGVVPGNGFGGGIPYGRAALIQAATSNISINGGMTAMNDVFIDGVPLSICCQNQIAFLPSIDTSQEFRVRTNMFDAQFGRTGGGVVTYATKAGSNEFHGSVFEFLRNADFDANNFFSNRNGLGIGHYTYNQFGGRAGGPLVHDKLFFFGNYEGIRNRKINFLTGNVPTTAEAGGLYSVPVFDPLTTVKQGNNFIRSAFPGNQIPQSRLDPVAVKVIKLYPAPNSTVAGSNYIASAPATDVEDQMNVRFDYVISQNNRLFARYSYNHNNGDIPDWFHDIASPGDFSQEIRNHNAVLNDTITFSPSFVGSFLYGFTRQANVRAARSSGTDLTQFGWPAAYSAARQTSALPLFSLTGDLGLSSNALFVRNADVQTVGANFDKVVGRHDLKFGFDGRLYQTNWVNNGNAAGTFSFNNGFTRGPDAQTGGGGSPVASMMLGYPASASLDIVQPFSSPEIYLGLFLQDDIRLSKSLTLNVGLRWEVEMPRSERYNRLSYFDPTVASPLAGPAGVPNLVGGLQFLGVNGNPTRQQDTDWNNFEPRVGFAWNAMSKLVVRGGYGIVYMPITTRYMSNSNQGFSATTNFLSSSDGGLTPVGTLSNPFPAGITQPAGAQPGLLSSIGQSFSTLLAQLAQCLRPAMEFQCATLAAAGPGVRGGVHRQQRHQAAHADSHQQSALRGSGAGQRAAAAGEQPVPEIFRQWDAVGRDRHRIATAEAVSAVPGHHQQCGGYRLVQLQRPDAQDGKTLLSRGQRAGGIYRRQTAHRYHALGDQLSRLCPQLSGRVQPAARPLAGAGGHFKARRGELCHGTSVRAREAIPGEESESGGPRPRRLASQWNYHLPDGPADRDYQFGGHHVGRDAAQQHGANRQAGRQRARPPGQMVQHRGLHGAGTVPIRQHAAHPARSQGRLHTQL